MVKRYVVYAANCICDAPPNSDGQYVLVADYDALAARLAEANAAFEAEQTEKWKMAGRLAEAERLLNNIQFVLPLDSPTYRSWNCQYDAFLRPADSATVCLHQIHNGDTCEICGAKVTP